MAWGVNLPAHTVVIKVVQLEIIPSDTCDITYLGYLAQSNQRCPCILIDKIFIFSFLVMSSLSRFFLVPGVFLNLLLDELFSLVHDMSVKSL